eukprot:TRINITY_DN555_c0_g1_i1.p1 TRINITY_DN555_c0_g1~~TRINITY_DN555_c0_g1_i1.p1  ORF type:complete len:1667 (+),score=409.67 TRINITY_DN555_c0_g1_i1:54-5054(+)
MSKTGFVAASFNPNDFAPGSKVWIPSEEEAWIPGEVYEVIGDGLSVRVPSGFVIVKKDANGVVVTTEKGQLYGKINEPTLRLKTDDMDESPDNLTNVPDLHEAAILGYLRDRQSREKIYTNVGMILLAMNPWKEIPHLYDEKSYARYSKCDLTNAPPHLYKVAEEAYVRLIEEKQSQAILVSGESGAGKTESCKLMMKYIGQRASGGQLSDIASRIMQSNPVLEAFGNAKTFFNNNSSRFGKFVQIIFDNNHAVLGAKIDTYLLEKSRVVSQATTDRNYHIFYQILSTADPSIISDAKLRDPSFYKFLVSQDYLIDGIDDAEELKETMSAMKGIGITEIEQKAIFRFLSAILYLGNIVFEADREGNARFSSAEVQGFSSLDCLATACNLLGVDEEAIRAAFVSRRILVNQVATEKKYSVAQAEESRNAFCKYIYARIFDWILKRINESLEPSKKARRATEFIGLLDISGFESFKVNSLEQLCINYSNERLQQIFNSHVFKLEQEEYENEKIEWEKVAFTDNNDVLDLIEKKPGGIIAFLDDTCRNASGTDDSFMNSLLKAHTGSSVISKNKLDQKKFNVKHFAGEVEYTTTGFRDRNGDNIHNDLISALQTSSDEVMKRLVPASELFRSQQGSRPTGTANALMTDTIMTAFKKQLDELSKILYSCNRYFVRCMKPNIVKTPGLIVGREVVRQLRYGGVIEAVNIILRMYPTRMDRDIFYKRYTESQDWMAYFRSRKFTPDSLQSLKTPTEKAEAIRSLCEKMNLVNVQDFQIGRSKVFFRAGILARVESHLAIYQNHCARKIGVYYRYYRAKMRCRAIFMMQSAFRSFSWEKKLREIAARRIIRFFRKIRARGLLYNLIHQRYQTAILDKKRHADVIKAVLRQKKYRLFVSRLKVTLKAIVAIQAAFRARRVRKKLKIQAGLKIHDQLKNIRQEKEELIAEKTKLEEDKSSLEESFKSQGREKEKLELLLSNERSETSSLQRQLDEFKSKYAALQAQHQDLQDLNAQTTQSMEGYRKSLESEKKLHEITVSKNAEALKASSFEMSLLKKQLEDRISTGNATRETLVAIIQSMKLRISSLCRDYKLQKDEIMAQVNLMFTQYTQEIAPKITKLEQMLLREYATNQELRNEIDALLESISMKDKLVDKVGSDIRQLEDDLGRERQAHKETREQLEESEKRNRAFESSLEDANNKIEELERRCAVMSDQYAREKKRAGQLRFEMQSSQNSQSRLQIPVDIIPDLGVIERPTANIQQRDIVSQTRAIGARYGVHLDMVVKAPKGLFGYSSAKAWHLHLDGSSVRIYSEKKEVSDNPKYDFSLDGASLQFGDSQIAAQSTRSMSVSSTLTLTSGKEHVDLAFNEPPQAAEFYHAFQLNSKMVNLIKNMISSKQMPDPRLLSLFGRTDITKISLDAYPIVFDTTVALGDAIQENCKVETLSIRYAQLDSAHVKGLEKRSFHRLTSLKVLNLDHNRLDMNAMRALADCLKSAKELEVLDVSYNPIQDSSCSHFETIVSGHKYLKTLNLNSTAIGNDTVDAVAKAFMAHGVACRLESIQLANNKIDSGAAKVLSTLLSSVSTIKSVFLQGNVLSDSGCKAIFDASNASKSVRILDISNNGIEQETLKHIATVMKSGSSIDEIHLGRPSIDDFSIFAGVQDNYNVKDFGFKKFSS